MTLILLTTRYNVIAASYPWITHEVGYGNGPEHGSEHGRNPNLPGQTWVTLPQNTLEYGRKVVQWCHEAGIGYISGQWTKDFPTLDSFLSSVGAVSDAEMGNLKMIFLFDLGPGLAFVKQAIMNYSPRMLSPRYARIEDANHAIRWPIMFWGGVPKTPPPVLGGHDFRVMIDEVRQYLRTNHNINPYFIRSHHALRIGDQEIRRSVDAFYRHECAHNYDPNGHPAPLTTSESAPRTVNEWNADKNVLNTGCGGQRCVTFDPVSPLPVAYFTGAMPSLWRRSEVNRGKVICQNPRQAETMFEAIRSNSQTICTRVTAPGKVTVDRWVVITSWAEWSEDTCIEPCHVRPGREPDSPDSLVNGYDYGHDFLQIIARRFRTTVQQVQAESLPEEGIPVE